MRGKMQAVPGVRRAVSVCAGARCLGSLQCAHPWQRTTSSAPFIVQSRQISGSAHVHGGEAFRASEQAQQAHDRNLPLQPPHGTATVASPCARACCMRFPSQKSAFEGHRRATRRLVGRCTASHAQMLVARMTARTQSHEGQRVARALATRTVAIVADDKGDFEALRPFGNVSLAARIPALDRAPWEDLAVCGTVRQHTHRAEENVSVQLGRETGS